MLINFANKKLVLVPLILFFSFLLPCRSNSQPATQIELDINNVRTTLLNQGDLWWNPDNGQAKYEIPKVDSYSEEESTHSIFAGALWIGAIDEYGQLKVAAQTYRQGGVDYFPGPISEIPIGPYPPESETNYDRFWKVNATTIDSFRADFEASAGVLLPSQIHPSILYWAGKGNPNFTDFDILDDRDMAPFWDNDLDGIYDATKGDYPTLKKCSEGIYADQMIWWIFNDHYHEHEYSGGHPLSVEITTLAYAFKTDDDLNNATFYKYTISNRSPFRLDSLSIGQWVDTDLGQFDDDYVGCSPDYNMGITYNGDAIDGDYGNKPPMLGIQFLEGIKELKINEDGEPITHELGMSNFRYYAKSFTATGWPETAGQRYKFLNGLYLNGAPMTYGGNAYGGDSIIKFQYPHDPTLPLPYWSECSEDNTSADRAILMSMGPTTLDIDQTIDFTVGVYWVQPDIEPVLCPTFQYLTDIADLAESFLDNLCSNTISGISNNSSLLNTSELNITPNPATDRIAIQSDLFAEENCSVQLFDNLGREIYKQKSTELNSKQLSINSTDFPSGLYILRIETLKGNHSRKISILH